LPKDPGTADQNRKPDEVRGAAPATLVVTLPAGATLKVDDFVSQSAEPTRRFVSPPLERGKDYHYTLTAEMKRDDKPITVNKPVTVRAGETTRVSLVFSEASAASK
jgi:uncharacterized protein (TIGR03000 family)